MVNRTDIIWFKSNFADQINLQLEATPFDVDMLTAIACQETGELWGTMRRDKALTPARIASLCCGDTLDADKGRRAFPRTKADLLAASRGQEMFDIGRKALLDMAEHVPGYEFAKTKKNKFCHGYGVFQYDLQFFLTNPKYFLSREYEEFEKNLARAVGELKNGLKKLGLTGSSITDFEFCKVAICYNTGGNDPRKGLRQGRETNGKFYGEFIRDYLAIARTTETGALKPAVPVPNPGTAPLPVVNESLATGSWFEVDTRISTLRLRSEPRISKPKTANVIAELPDGQRLRAFNDVADNGFIHVEVSLGGQLFQGYASQQFLLKTGGKQKHGAGGDDAQLPAIPPARLTPPANLVTKRTNNATAHSLNEKNMPRRASDNPDGLRDDIQKIIGFLACDDPRHSRYQPRDGLTFCNIYAHDYCDLCNAYLPRVWWTPAAIVKIANGADLVAKIGNTVDELRANDLFRWLRDFGVQFGWRRAASLDEMQDHANLGGVALIVARRKEDGRSGHIVAVVPETPTETAKRDQNGNVTMPLQSQAGETNFRYGRSTPGWWLASRFADSAFWLHS